jgi:hypothetical protein
MNLHALLESPSTDDHWMDRANCLGVDPNLMQPERATEAEVAAAKAVCAGCPVLEQCRAHAEAQTPAYGVHAGEWWGDEPVWQIDKRCEYTECGAVFRVDRDTRVGQRARFCSGRCRVASHRAEVAAREAEREAQAQPVLEAPAKPTTCGQCTRRLPEGARRFCSPLCSGAAKRNRTRSKLPA